MIAMECFFRYPKSSSIKKITNADDKEILLTPELFLSKLSKKPEKFNLYRS